jgi:hypothetical protein
MMQSGDFIIPPANVGSRRDHGQEKAQPGCRAALNPRLKEEGGGDKGGNAMRHFIGAKYSTENGAMQEFSCVKSYCIFRNERSIFATASNCIEMEM